MTKLPTWEETLEEARTINKQLEYCEVHRVLDEIALNALIAENERLKAEVKRWRDISVELARQNEALEVREYPCKHCGNVFVIEPEMCVCPFCG